MSDDYQYVWQAIMHFGERLARQYHVKTHHAAHMFQLLFASGWEPMQTHYSLISEETWNAHLEKALRFHVPEIEPVLFPVQPHSWDGKEPLQSPDSSHLPVLFTVNKKPYIVTLEASVEHRKGHDRHYLDVRWYDDDDHGPYRSWEGKWFDNEGDLGDFQALHEFLLPSLGDGALDDFDEVLRQVLFDVVAEPVFLQGSAQLYEIWDAHLRGKDHDSFLNDQYNHLSYLMYEEARTLNVSQGIVRAEYTRRYETEQPEWSEQGHIRFFDGLMRFVRSQANYA
jgi:hypothetical protein